MKKMKKMTRMLIAITVLLGMQTFAGGKPYKLVKNPDFENRRTLFWTPGDPKLVSFIEEDGNRFCRMTLPNKKASIIERATSK